MKLFKLPKFNIWSALVDLIIVILGILIAFTLNTWWINRQNQSIERDLLMNLRDEVKLDKSEIELVINRIDSIRLSAEQLLSFVGPDAEEMPADKFWQFLKPCLGKMTYDGTNTVQSSIVNNGDIRLIKNLDIQYQLALLPSKLNDYLEDEEFTENALDLHLRPYVLSNFPTYSMDKRPGHFKVSTIKALRDPAFDSYLGRIHYRQGRLRVEILDYRSHLTQLVELIEAELVILN